MPDQAFIQLALDQARHAWTLDEVPVGAVVDRDGRVDLQVLAQRGFPCPRTR